MHKEKKSFLNYNTLKGRLIFAVVFGLAIIIGIKIIDTETLHNINLNLQNKAVGKYLDAMSIFVFVYGVMFSLYGAMGIYDAMTYITSEKAYAPKVLFFLIGILGFLQGLTGTDMIVRLLQMNGMLVQRHANIFSGIYLFTPAIKCLIYSLIMYVIRLSTDYFNRKQYEKLMEENQEMRDRKKQLEEFLYK